VKIIGLGVAPVTFRLFSALPCRRFFVRGEATLKRNWPRLYRDALLNSIWEGSGNVQCLEMLRPVKNDAGTLEMVLQDSRGATGGTNTSTAPLIDLSANWPRIYSKEQL
jgi:hypothetical protein